MPEDQTNLALRAIVEAHRDPGTPLHTQLESAIRTAIRDGLMPPGARLPPSRALAADLGVSRGVVVEAYEQLVAEGYLATRTGSATRVADTCDAPTTTRSAADRPADTTVRFDFRPGSPDTAAFPRTAWVRAIQHVTLHAQHTDLGYGDTNGHPTARATLAGWLTRTRATLARAEDVIVTTGFTQSMDLTCRVLRELGLDRIAVEDPGHPEQREMIGQRDIEPVPVPVDQDGLVVDALARTGTRAVLVTPAHQFPTGVVLAPDRRQALLGWARRTGSLVLEDDYDAEYRYDRPPVGCLQGLAPDLVVYAGTGSKMLAPALRLGWLIPPPQLAESFALGKSLADFGSPVIDQLALASMIDSGSLDRHLRRTRSSYRARRDTLVAALAEHLPAAGVRGIAAGLHAVVELPDGTDERAVEERAADRLIAVRGMHRYRATSTGPPALVLGYTRLPAGSIAAGVRELAAVCG